MTDTTRPTLAEVVELLRAVHTELNESPKAPDLATIHAWFMPKMAAAIARYDAAPAPEADVQTELEQAKARAGAGRAGALTWRKAAFKLADSILYVAEHHPSAAFALRGLVADAEAFKAENPAALSEIQAPEADVQALALIPYASHLANCRYASWSKDLDDCDCGLFALLKALGLPVAGQPSQPTDAEVQR